MAIVEEIASEGQSVIGTPVDIAGKTTWLGTAIIQGVGFLGLAEINTLLTIIFTIVSIVYGMLKVYEKILDIRRRKSGTPEPGEAHKEDSDTE